MNPWRITSSLRRLFGAKTPAASATRSDQSGTSSPAVYVELLNEGIPCIRPVPVEFPGENLFRLLQTADYDPEDEHWQFPPGSLVRCRLEAWERGHFLVARELVGAAD